MADLLPTSEGKKKVRREKEYEQNVRRRSRLQGTSYVTRKGILIPSRKQKSCRCKKACFKLFKNTERVEIWNRFYSLKSKDIQDTYLQDLITVIPITRRRRVNEVKTRSENVAHFAYHVLVRNSIIQVCHQAFLGMYGVSYARVYRLHQLAANGTSPADKRGEGQTRALLLETKAKIKQHIKLFPRYESHYSSVSYLSPQLSLGKMFKMFKMKYPDENVSYSSYRRIFNYNFKLSFGQPQVDVCGLCEEYKVKLRNKFTSDAVKEATNAQKATHIRRSKKFHEAIKKDRLEKNPEVLSICFDYIQNVNLPRIPIQESFYKRQLSVSVFCIHHIQENRSRFYVYHEGEAKKGPNEVCSFLHHFIFDEIKKSKGRYQVLHLYSDNCGGQNKNHTVLRFMQALTDNNIFEECRFFSPLRGHSYNDCDRQFGQIKKQLKTYDRIYTIRRIIQIILHSGLKKFEVVRICHTDILDFKNWWPEYYSKMVVSEETKTAPRQERNNFNIQGFFQFISTADMQGKMVTRQYIDGVEQQSFDLRQPGTVFPIPFPSGAAYKEPVKLSAEKLRDINALLSFVPEKYQPFYRNLT